MTKDFYFNTAEAMDKSKADRDKPVTPVEYIPVISDVGSDSNMLCPDTMYGLLPKGTGKITLHESKPAPVQEPVAWGCNRYIEDDNGFQIGTDEPELAWGKYAPDDNGWWPLYTTPPAAKRQWVGLTDEEFEDIELGCLSTVSGKIMAMQKVEAKLKEKNT